MVQRYSKFCWTLNNYTDDEIQFIRDKVAPLCHFMVFGYEIAPETGTPHLQGYCRLKKQMYVNKARNFVRRWHINNEEMKGTEEQNYIYCRKLKEKVPNEKWEEFGVMRKDKKPEKKLKFYQDCEKFKKEAYFGGLNEAEWFIDYLFREQIDFIKSHIKKCGRDDCKYCEKYSY